MSQRKVYHVTPAAEGGWQVKDEQEERAASTHEKKDEAVARAKELAKGQALYSVFGRFDLDPCSPRKAAAPVRARVHLTAEDDGLSLAWHGTVFVNPPYGRRLAACDSAGGAQGAPFPSALAVWGADPETLAVLQAALPGVWRAG